jgi:MFS family permease
MQLPAVWRTNLVAFLLGAGMYSSFILIPQLVELPKSTGFGFGAAVTAAGRFMVPSTVMMLVAGSLAGRLEHRFGSKPLLVAGAFATAASFAVLAFAHHARIDIYLGSTLLGIGIGLAFAALANLIVEAVPPDQTGVATGVNTIARSLGGALGSQVVASLLAGSVVGAASLPSESGFTLSFALASGLLLLSAGFALAIPSRRRAESADPAKAATEAGVA